MFLLASRDMAAFFPTICLKSGLSDVTARKKQVCDFSSHNGLYVHILLELIQSKSLKSSILQMFVEV